MAMKLQHTLSFGITGIPVTSTNNFYNFIFCNYRYKQITEFFSMEKKEEEAKHVWQRGMCPVQYIEDCEFEVGDHSWLYHPNAWNDGEVGDGQKNLYTLDMVYIFIVT